MVPNFLRKQPIQEAVHYVDEVPQMPRRPGNPFERAAGDLADQWDQMVADLEHARAAAERDRAENVFLSERVDSLSRELAATKQWAEFELERQTIRADRAVELQAARRAKLEVIADAIRMLLDEEMETPVRQRPAAPAARPEAPPAAQPAPEREEPEAPRQQRPRVPVIPLSERLNRATPISPAALNADDDTREVRAIIDRIAPPAFT